MISSKGDLPDHQASLAMLGGSRLSAVGFTKDYLTLTFDGVGDLTTFVWPEVAIVGRTIMRNDLEYQDALCSLIGRLVNASTIDAAEVIRIEFDQGSALRIAVRASGSRGDRVVLSQSKQRRCSF